MVLIRLERVKGNGSEQVVKHMDADKKRETSAKHDVFGSSLDDAFFT